mmetsp:Transcript_34905/g.62825  ORF Transcript_34905/g.62825 Transcript_34905/m.62825 type:complete len:101 (-) Transcript_34905:101-403(-)
MNSSSVSSQGVSADGLLRAAADLIWRDAVGGGVYFSAREDDGDHHLVCMQAQFFVVVVSMLLLVGCTVRSRNCLLLFGSGIAMLLELDSGLTAIASNRWR